MPSVRKQIVELYGFPTEVRTLTVQKVRQRSGCPFTGKNCTKTSDRLGGKPIGTCLVSHAGLVWAICPVRFRQGDIVYRDLSRRFWPHAKRVCILKEIGLPEAGRVDQVLAKVSLNEEIEDFFGLEWVAVDTTGELATAQRDAMKGHQHGSYKFGINHRNVVKRTVEQIHFKGKVFEAAKRRIVWVMQDTLFDTFAELYDMGELTDGFKPGLTTVFYIVKFEAMTKGHPTAQGESPTHYQLTPKSIRSTSYAGLKSAFEPKIGGIRELERQVQDKFRRAEKEFLDLG